MDLDEKILQVWDNALSCFCSVNDCFSNHKLCGICRDTILYVVHESNQPNSRYAWNVDHIVPLSRGGSNHITNLQAVHIECNCNKRNY
ncbi:HNH endonuclease signature motif containing protein [Spiroplasma endosymbiont of Lonchoptera lutea]|uniref:HNH endonuclease n=1 Tax=Spiroplasma endosymbiont of Lonchoptera lutea TaxID=3066297 RepID=UPI0030D32FAF